EGGFQSLSDDDKKADAGKTLPPRIGRTKRSLPKRKKPPALPPTTSSKPSRPPARETKPKSRPAPKRTMMMTPLDEAFFDALDTPEASSTAETTGDNLTRPHRTAGAAS